MGCPNFPHMHNCACERCNESFRVDLGRGPFGLAFCSKPPNHRGDHTAIYNKRLVSWRGPLHAVPKTEDT